jgi:hypothetical protein
MKGQVDAKLIVPGHNSDIITVCRGYNFMPLVFQYGSNCDRERLNNSDRLDGDAVDLGLAQTVREYEIAFNKWSTKGQNAAADLAKPRQGGRRCWGVLYRVSRAGFKKLREIEGPSYRPQRMVVEDATGTAQKVTTFRVRRAKRKNDRHTSFNYVRHIVCGLRAHDAPEDYVQHIIDVAIQTNRRSPAAAAVEESRQIEGLRIR